MLLVCIDPGHGGKDSGAQGNGLNEKDINLDISLRQKAAFERLGHTVVLLRADDRALSLPERTDTANAKKVQFYVSNHVNSGGGKGVEVWHSIYAGKGKEVAIKVVNNLTQAGFVNRGAKSREGSNGDYYHVIRETAMPAIIIEHGFIDNTEDAAKLKDPTFRQKCAEAAVKGILEAYGYQYSEPKPEPVKAADKYGIVTASVLNVRSGRGTNFGIIGKLPKDRKVKLCYKLNGWWSIDYGPNVGYVSADYIKEV